MRQHPFRAVRIALQLCALLALCFGLHAVAQNNQQAPPAPPTPAPQTPAPQTPSGETPSGSRDLRAVRPAGTATQGPVAIPRSYALIVGISHYQNLPEDLQLRFPSRDAEEMYTTLISPEGGQFAPENVHRLIDSDATETNLRRELEQWLPSVTKPGDRVLVYFAGHGFIGPGGKGYLAPYDIDRHNVAGTAYPMDTLGRVFSSDIQGKWKVLITDACHSGAITPEDNPAQLNGALKDLNPSLFSLTASRDREQSFESPEFGGGHGIFTYYVAEGMKGAADTNGDGVVDADELAEYVHTNVRMATKGAQNPTSERGSFDPNMVIAYNPTLRKATAVTTPQFGKLVIESNMDNTEVWIDGKNQGTASKATPLTLPGIAPGAHTIKGVHLGYEPDGPREEVVYPGQDTTVSLHINIVRRHQQAATDLLDRGVQEYKNGDEANYRKAAESLQKAIAIDPQYSTAYMYLGRVQNALYENEAAVASFRRAIEIDPDYTEARTSYASALLDQGDLDEAVRQLNVATQHEAKNATAWYLLSQAYGRKSVFPECKSAAERAVEYAPGLGEAHFWLAQCELKLNQPAAAEKEYSSYLALSHFDSGTAGKVNYYLGFLTGMGKKTRASQADIWREDQGLANAGMCQCEEMQNNYTGAISLCQKALTFMPQDMWTNYYLGRIYIKQANQQQLSPALLNSARMYFQKVIANDPDTEAAARARKYVDSINTALPANH